MAADHLSGGTFRKASPKLGSRELSLLDREPHLSADPRSHVHCEDERDLSRLRLPEDSPTETVNLARRLGAFFVPEMR
jgi:hypothetical protein